MDENFLNVLVKLKEKYGEEVFSSPQKAKGLLLDLAPNMKRELILFINLLNSNGYKEIKDGDTSSLYRALNNLEHLYSVKKSSAIWIINIFSTVLNDMAAEKIIDEFEDDDSQEEFKIRTDLINSKTLMALGENHTIALTKDGTLLATGDNTQGQCDISKFKDIKAVYAGNNYTVGITVENKVIAVGDNKKGQCNTNKWSNIKEVIATKELLLGLRDDKKIVATGKNSAQFNNEKWEDLIFISASDEIVAGIKSTGKVVSNNSDINISHWRDIVYLAVSNSHIVGLRKDGKVMAAGRNNFSQCEVSAWEDIVQISVGDTNSLVVESAKEQLTAIEDEVRKIFAKDMYVIRQLDRIQAMKLDIVQDYESLENASSISLNNLEDEHKRMFTLLYNRDRNLGGRYKAVYDALISIIDDIEKYEFCSACHTVGLKKDGTVLATGWNGFSQCNVKGFFNVRKIITGGFHTLGIKYDGSVVITGTDDYNQHFVSTWKNIQDAYLSKAGEYIIGLKTNRTLCNAGNDNLKQCNVELWNNIGNGE